MREIMDAMSPSHPCTDCDFQKGTQIAGSEGMYNVLGFYVDRVPCPIMLVMPTTDTAKKVSRQRIQPMIDETPALSAKIREARSRDSGNTMLVKDFPGGMLMLVGANSGPALRSTPIRVLLEDEIDAYPDDVDGEGDPQAVAEKRTDTFGSRAKRARTSTPKQKGKSRIDRGYRNGTQALYYVPCPHCSREQALHWGQVRWEMLKARELVCTGCGVVSALQEDAATHADCPACRQQLALDERTLRETDTEEIDRVWYECEGCSGEIEEHHKAAMLARGRHVHHAPGAGMWLEDDDANPHAIWVKAGERIRRFLPRFTKPLSWKVPALYSLLGFTWLRAVQEFLKSRNGGFNEETGESLDQVFWNTVCAEAYEVKGEQPKDETLSMRAEAYRLASVPDGALLLTASVDVQGDRVEVKVKGYGEGEESWLIDYQVLHGDPRKAEVWAQLIEYRDRSFFRSSGQTMRIEAMAVDSGYLTQEVYDFCRKWKHKTVFATKGQAVKGKPILGTPAKIDVRRSGKKIKGGAEVWPIGTDTAKVRIYARLELSEPGPGYMHFPLGLPNAYFEGLTAEKLVRRQVKGVEVHDWIKTRERNEPLDLEVLCYAAALRVGLQRINWESRKRTITQGDLFVQQDTPAGPSRAPGLGDDGPAPAVQTPAQPPRAPMRPYEAPAMAAPMEEARPW